MFVNFINLRAHPKHVNQQASSIPGSIRQYRVNLADKRLIFISVDLSFFGLRPILLATPTRDQPYFLKQNPFYQIRPRSAVIRFLDR